MPEDKDNVLQMVQYLARFGLDHKLSIYELSTLAIKAARFMLVRRDSVVDDFTTIDDEAKDWELDR